MTTPDPAAPAAPAPGADLGPRLDRLEATINAFVGQAHQGAQAHTEARLERPNTVEQQVEAALRQADDSRRRREADDAAKKFREETTAAIKALQETRPAEAVRGVTRAMWG